MIVGKMLKEKYGFDSEAVIDMFCDQYGYSHKFVNDLLNDVWDDLLLCHSEDILDFTKISEELFKEWHGEPSGFGYITAPMGKACKIGPAPLSKIEISLGQFEPKLFITRTPNGDTVRAGFFPNPGEEEMKPEEIQSFIVDKNGFGTRSCPPIWASSVPTMKDLTSPDWTKVESKPEQDEIKTVDYPNLVRPNESVKEMTKEELDDMFTRLRELANKRMKVTGFKLTIKDLAEVLEESQKEKKGE